MTHDADPELLQQSFKARLLRWREEDPTGHLYVLLDPAQTIAAYHELAPKQLAGRDVAPRQNRVLRPDLQHAPDVLPILLQLYAAGENGYPDEGLLDATLACAVERCQDGRPAYVAGWIWTQAGPRMLSSHLARSGVMFDLKQGRERFIPLFEPHRLMLFAGCLTEPAALDAWLGPVEHWLALDGAHQLRCFDHSGRRAAAARPGKACLGLAASASQERVAMGRRVSTSMREAALTPPYRPELAIDLAIQRAQARGLKATEDIIFYALNDFTCGHLGWSEHPLATAAIDRVTRDRSRVLAGEFMGFSDAELESIAAPAASKRSS